MPRWRASGPNRRTLAHVVPELFPAQRVRAVSEYMRAVPDQIQAWVPGPYTSLGTDGWGMSDTREALRRHFLVDAESVTICLL